MHLQCNKQIQQMKIIICTLKITKLNVGYVLLIWNLLIILAFLSEEVMHMIFIKIVKCYWCYCYWPFGEQVSHSHHTKTKIIWLIFRRWPINRICCGFYKYNLFVRNLLF